MRIKTCQGFYLQFSSNIRKQIYSLSRRLDGEFFSSIIRKHKRNPYMVLFFDEINRLMGWCASYEVILAPKKYEGQKACEVMLYIRRRNSKEKLGSRIFRKMVDYLSNKRIKTLCIYGHDNVSVAFFEKMKKLHKQVNIANIWKTYRRRLSGWRPKL